MSLDRAFNKLKDRTGSLVDEWGEIMRLFDRAAEGLRSFVEDPTDRCPVCGEKATTPEGFCSEGCMNIHLSKMVEDGYVEGEDESIRD